MKKRDFIVIGIILAVIAVLFVVFDALKKDGAYVVVRINGEIIAKYDLLEDGEYELNGGTNVLKIEQGKAYLVSANCPDHLCVKQGKIDQSGETITCLPNKLTVTVYGAGSEVDLVS